jgi:RNA polymerase sigma-70 factor (ECF subfamily)
MPASPINVQSFEEYAMPLFDSLYNFAMWLARNRDEAEDLVQETYAKALKGFSSFQPGTNFRAWMFRILRNAFLNSRTGLKMSQTALEFDSDSPLMPATQQTPESILLRQINHEALYRAIEQLPIVFREVLILRDVEEMNYQEVAEALSIPIGTVMSRLSRARRLLRDMLQDHGKESKHVV